ncbi:MAG: Ig-like domain-containing protein [Chitinophagales bacterium]|nr:Ig-like domain-containing protein [Chitinophagales bacterium]
MLYLLRQYHLYIVIILSALISCARQGAPAGGPKDTRPPEVDSLRSTPNFSTRFDKRKVELKFDEWVLLSDVATQIVVSPPLAKRPEVVLKGRTVVLTLDKNEVLRPNTTYTINFGASVKDLHESNPAKDLRFVFSTGDFIDSLGFRGSVVDAFSGEPVENIAILLHENLNDTAVIKERPYYFTKTDKSGQFGFQNLKAGVFQIVAIEGADVDLKWDGANEKIAFISQPVTVSDSLKVMPALKLFKNQPSFRLQNQQTGRYGLAKVVFNGAADSVRVQWQDIPGARMLLEKAPDSLSIWYDLPVDTSWFMELRHPAWVKTDSASGLSRPFADTIRIKKLNRADFMEKHQLSFADAVAPVAAAGQGRGKSAAPSTPKPLRQPPKTVIQLHSQEAMLAFNYPLQTFDTAFWQLQLDSVVVRQFSVRKDSLQPGKLILSTNWKQGKTYALTLLPGALTDFWGKTLSDTLRRNFNVTEEKQLGSLTVNFSKLRPGSAYVFELLNNNTLEATRQFVAETDTYQLNFEQLQVAGYTGRLLEDRNKNGRWDTGNFAQKLQPETLFTKKMDPLRANWSLDVDFSAEVVSEKKRKQ